MSHLSDRLFGKRAIEPNFWNDEARRTISDIRAIEPIFGTSGAGVGRDGWWIRAGRP
jgi:hypothetical protein